MDNDGINWDYRLEDTVYGTILLRTQERIRAAKLQSIEHEKIVIRKQPWVPKPQDPPTPNDLLPPYITISPRPEIVNWQDGTSERDGIVYGVLIAIVLANGRDLTEKGMGLQLMWRETVRGLFHNRSLRTWRELGHGLPAGVSFDQSYIEGGEKFLDSAKMDGYDAQYWLLRVRTRERRPESL